MTISSFPQQALWIALVHLSFIYINQNCNNMEERSPIINSCPLKRQHILLLPKYLASHWNTGNFPNILWCFLYSYMPGIPYSFHQSIKNHEEVLWSQTPLFKIPVTPFPHCMIFSKSPNSLNFNVLIYKLGVLLIATHRAVERLNKISHVEDLAKCLAIAYKEWW